MEIDPVTILVRWLHIAAAIVAAGGAIFARFVAAPALESLPADLRSSMHEEMRKRFVGLVMASIAVLLLTGFYNYLRQEMPAHRGQGGYHGLMGAKILLAMGVFFLASALVGRSPALEWVRAKRKLYLGINVLLAMMVVALGAVLRAIPDAAAAPQ